MLVPGILGFQSLVYVLLVFAFMVIRQVWRNAEKKDEIIRLVEHTSMAEIFIGEATAAIATAFPFGRYWAKLGVIKASSLGAYSSVNYSNHQLAF
ncbi:hypothetical protein RJT34_11628 [Clitoria ternatea]|uniref:Uncharacterized protein n=1 Tax=Clitoria ternatea TaxID=43366 RepID=A0AAN9JMZ9_CLITE